MINNIKIIRKNIKHAYLKITDIGEIIITIPNNMSDELIYDYIQQSKSKIQNKIEILKRKTDIKHDLNYSFNDNSQIYYFGKLYNVRHVISDIEKINITDNIFEIHLQNPNSDFSKILIARKYMNDELLKYIEKYIDIHYIKICQKRPTWSIMSLTSRWADYNPLKHHIRVNEKMASLPPECIEGLIFHELTHIIHPNHSIQFYNLLSKLYPKWKQYDNLLKNMKL